MSTKIDQILHKIKIEKKSTAISSLLVFPAFCCLSISSRRDRATFSQALFIALFPHAFRCCCCCYRIVERRRAALVCGEPLTLCPLSLFFPIIFSLFLSSRRFLSWCFLLKKQVNFSSTRNWFYLTKNSWRRVVLLNEQTIQWDHGFPRLNRYSRQQQQQQ